MKWCMLPAAAWLAVNAICAFFGALYLIETLVGPLLRQAGWGGANRVAGLLPVVIAIYSPAMHFCSWYRLTPRRKDRLPAN